MKLFENSLTVFFLAAKQRLNFLTSHPSTFCFFSAALENGTLPQSSREVCNLFRKVWAKPQPPEVLRANSTMGLNLKATLICILTLCYAACDFVIPSHCSQLRSNPIPLGKLIVSDNFNIYFKSHVQKVVRFVTSVVCRSSADDYD